ncbi:MAG: DNA/RNA non-specific endonuclease [Planctomycetota bacterium]
MRLIPLLLLAACAAPPGAASPGLVGGLFGDEAILAADILKYGFPGEEHLRYRSGYILSYDGARRVPRWVAERLDPSTVTGEVDEEAKRFRPDESLPEAIRADHADFLDSGYVRGRLAAAANHKGDPDAFAATYLLSNCAPQRGGTFRQTVWGELERAVRAWAKDCDDLYVVTGTVFQSDPPAREVRYPVIGEGRVAVPTHYYKVLLRERGGSLDMLAFLVPHVATEEETDLAGYLVPVDDLEARTGLDFFPALTDPTQADLEKRRPTEVWKR